MSQPQRQGSSRSITSVSKLREPSNRAVVGVGPTGGKDFDEALPAASHRT